MTGFTPRVRRLDDGEQNRLALARSLFREGRLEEATAELARILEGAPRFIPALLLMGRILQKQKRPEEAAPWLDAAVEQAPLEMEPALRAARAHLSLGNIDRAEDLFRTAQNLDAKSAWARVGLGLVAGQRDQGEAALEHLMEAVRLDPTLVQARLSLARTLRRLERSEEAAEHLRAVLDRDPGHGTAGTQLVRLLLKVGHADEAERVMQTLIRFNPDDFNMLRQIARLTVSAGRHAAAEQVLRALLALRPDSLATRVRLAQALAPQGKTDEARALIADVPRRRAVVPLLYATEGDIVLAEGNAEGAVGAFRAAVINLPDGDALMAEADAAAEKAGGALTAEVLARYYQTVFTRALKTQREARRARRSGGGAGEDGRESDADL